MSEETVSVYRHDAVIAISGDDLKQAALFFDRR